MQVAEKLSQHFEETKEAVCFGFVDDQMKRMVTLVKQAAATNTSLLITGEESTGKKTIAREIHRQSIRQGLLGTIDFGLATSAEVDLFFRKNIHNAQYSTWILENIERLSSEHQLQLNQWVRSQGESRNPIRVVATSSSDFNREVHSGGFFKELYYRLNIIRIEVPALRFRKRDIATMANFYLENHSLGADYANMSFTQEAIDAMINHSWPGNLHELQVVVQRAILLSTSYEIDRDCIEIQSAEGMNNKWVMALPIGLPMKDVETHFILETLKHHEGNRTHCAKTLGISLRTLRNKINEFRSRGIDVVEPMRRAK